MAVGFIAVLLASGSLLLPANTPPQDSPGSAGECQPVVRSPTHPRL